MNIPVEVLVSGFLASFLLGVVSTLIVMTKVESYFSRRGKK